MLIRVRTAPAPGHRREGPRTFEPLTFGVPLPRGLAKETDNWTLGPAGMPGARVQTRVLERWVDGSARWVLVDAQVSLSDDGHAVLDLAAPGAAALDGPSVLTAVKTGHSVVVDTGAARFELAPGEAFPFASVQQDGRATVASTALVVTDRSGVRRSAVISSVDVEETGSTRAVVALRGSVSADGSRQLDVTARVHFFARLATARISVTLTNPSAATHPGGFWDLGDRASVLVKDVSVTLAVGGAGACAVACSPEMGAPLEPFDAPFEIYQDSSGGENWRSSNHLNRERRVPVSFRGYRVRTPSGDREGLRASPVVSVSRGDIQVNATVENFWQNFPKAISVDGSTVSIQLFPSQFDDLHEIQGGEQKTHDIWISTGADAVSSMPLAWCRSRTVAWVDPDWTIASGAVPFLAALEQDHAALLDQAIEGPDRFEMKREVIDEYGWRHFGEAYGDHEGVSQQGPPLVSHYNNQYDMLGGFILQFLRTGDVRWWTMASELAAHVVDIDVYHTDRDKSAYNGGMFWHTYHYGDADTATHRSYPKAGYPKIHGGGPSADHNYTGGLLLHYFLTGHVPSRDTAIVLANYVINMDDGSRTVFRWLDSGDTGRAAKSAPEYYGPGRGPANSLAVLVDAYRLTGERRYLDKAERIVRRVVHPKDDIDRHELDVHEERWFYTMFLQSLSRYLDFKTTLGQCDQAYDYARQSLLHYARWMVPNTYPYLDKPEKLRYPTETWPAQDMRKSDVFFAAARSAENSEERERFLERAQFFYRSSIDTLSTLPTRRFTRPVAVLLTSGFMKTAKSERWLPGEAVAGGFGEPERFVSQRKKAEMKARRLAVAAGVTGVIAALWLAAQWLA